MIASFPARDFQLLEYKVSHGSLLVRSPRKPFLPTNIDIIFVGVEFMSIPRLLKGASLSKGLVDDVQSAHELLGRDIEPERVFVITSQGKRFLIVAAGYRIDENSADIFDSPFLNS